jgi:hypothetical protein
MGYFVKFRRNGRICGSLGPFTTQKLAVRQAQPFADDAAPGVVVTVEPAPKRANKSKAKARRKRNARPRPGTPPLATTHDLVDWTPMNARTARALNPRPRRKKTKRKNKRRARPSVQLKLF